MASIRPFLRPQRLRALFFPSSSPSPSPLALSQTFLSHARPSILRDGVRAASTSALAEAEAEAPPKVPAPTPLVPDVATFLTVIGRGLKQHAGKIPDWESLFTMTPEELRGVGVEPPRARKYLLRWRQRFREGRYGVGGDLRHVEGGVAHLRILEADPSAPGADPARTPPKYVVNVPSGRAVADCDPAELSRVVGYRARGAKTIVGPYAMPLKGSEGAVVTVTDGMWEDRRGHKIDGGERRRTEVRFKRRIAERREAREKAEL
ncbi:putative igr protein domain-containing protein [Rosellinia necatrix]|uniref:Small ribosomal subunit protein mS41 n=1 Tax=Rosellinia necatrix TaxID=77044 RepID=A0A1W2TLI5_ROSNE|nr:putative igr protein domain-containing protein [Rosellinia necatrix]